MPEVGVCLPVVQSNKLAAVEAAQKREMESFGHKREQLVADVQQVCVHCLMWSSKEHNNSLQPQQHAVNASCFASYPFLQWGSVLASCLRGAACAHMRHCDCNTGQNPDRDKETATGGGQDVAQAAGRV